MKKINLSVLANKINAYQTTNHEVVKHNALNAINDILDDNLPHGSGIDSGVKLDFELSKANHVVFRFSFHHLNADGYYIGWSHHYLHVTPSFIYGIELTIKTKISDLTKELKEAVKDNEDYLYQTFDECFTLNN